MSWNFLFFFNSVFLGAGLAMDAFSVSMANGLNEPEMKAGRMCVIAGTYGIFQILMPLTGWVCVHTIVEKFQIFEKMIPWIALILLVWIGGKMVYEGLHPENDTDKADAKILGYGTLLVQGIATSIDALSVGFTISDYGFVMALVCSVIIGVITFFICIGGLIIGKTIGTKLSGKAGILGGVILILIGLEIFTKGVFF